MKNKKLTILILLLFLLVSNSAVFSLDASQFNLTKNKFEGEKLGIIIKLDQKFNSENKVTSYLTKNEAMPTNEEITKLFKFIEDYFRQHTNMKILNLSDKQDLQNYDYNDIYNRYKIDYLCIVGLSNLDFDFHNRIMIDKKQNSFIEISYRDEVIIEVFNSDYIVNFNLKFDSEEDTVTKTKYSYYTLISYKLFDLSKEEKLIYSEQEDGSYKTNTDYSKFELMKRATVDSLEESAILRKDFKIEFFQ